MNLTIIGIGLAKISFSVGGIDKQGTWSCVKARAGPAVACYLAVTALPG